jgi:hypothetical protein
MRKGWEKEKEKGFPRWWAGGNFGLAAAQGEVTARAREERTPSPRAHMPARAEGETAPRVDGAGEPVVRGGRNPAAGGPVLGQWVVALAWGGSGEPRGGLNLARGVRGGCPLGGCGAPRRESPSVSFGRGIGVGEWCSEFTAM